jgi:hypothetical protein
MSLHENLKTWLRQMRKLQAAEAEAGAVAGTETEGAADRSVVAEAVLRQKLRSRR